MDEAAAWREVGRRLAKARQQVRPELKKRAAARKAGINEATWRHLEDGEVRTRGGSHPPNPSNEYLEAAAIAVGIDPAEIFGIVGRVYEGPYRPPGTSEDADLEDRVGDLEVRLSAVEETVDRVADRLGLQR